MEKFQIYIQSSEKLSLCHWLLIFPAVIFRVCFQGKLWSRSVKLAYTLLNKLGTKNEQVIKPGDRVSSSTVAVIIFFFDRLGVHLEIYEQIGIDRLKFSVIILDIK